MSHSEQSDQPKGFKFKDSRRFDSDGNERASAVEVEKPVVVPAPEAPRPEPKAAAVEKPRTRSAPEAAQPRPSVAGPGFVAHPAAEEEDTQDEGAIEFRSFVVSLATQALMQMGVMEPPPGIEAQLDKEGARQTIEILSMLHRKTKGNLDDEEQRLIDEVLHSLRLNFLRLG